MAAGCLPYKPALVTVTGTAQGALGYGPPGFGEDPVHDAKEPYILLTTDIPFCVSGGKPNSEDVTFPWFRPCNWHTGWVSTSTRDYLGQHIAVSGTLFHRVSGGHTDVVIDVTAVKRVP